MTWGIKFATARGADSTRGDLFVLATDLLGKVQRLSPGHLALSWSHQVKTSMSTLPLLLRFLASLFCLVAILNTEAAAAAAVGTVTKVQEEAQVYHRSPTGLESITAVVGTPVHLNDSIRTGPRARLQITFRDGTTLTLGEHARVVVDRYVFDPDTSTGAMALNATRGALRFATGKLSQMRDKDITVTTPVAALAVRGTDFWAGFVDYQYGVLLVSNPGKVEVSNSAGSKTLSTPGHGLDIAPSLKDDLGPGDPYFWPEEKVQAALGQTSFGAPVSPGVVAPVAPVVPPPVPPVPPTSP